MQTPQATDTAIFLSNFMNSENNSATQGNKLKKSKNCEPVYPNQTGVHSTPHCSLLTSESYEVGLKSWLCHLVG